MTQMASKYTEILELMELQCEIVFKSRDKISISQRKQASVTIVGCAMTTGFRSCCFMCEKRIRSRLYNQYHGSLSAKMECICTRGTSVNKDMGRNIKPRPE